MNRRQELARLFAENPTLTAREAAERMGISRQRIYDLNTRLQLPFRRVYTRSTRSSTPTAPRSRILTGGVEVLLSHSVVGRIAELLTAADLTARGYVVFYPIYTRALCDLVALTRDGTALRVEVRCGRRAESGVVKFTKKDTKACDVYAVVLIGEPVHYDPPLP